MITEQTHRAGSARTCWVKYQGLFWQVNKQTVWRHCKTSCHLNRGEKKREERMRSEVLAVMQI